MNYQFVIPFGIIALLLILQWQVRASRNGKGNPDRFFLSRSDKTREQFGSAQVAFYLQMATLYPFFLFAWEGKWWLALWNVLFWTAGILLFMFVLPRFRTVAKAINGTHTLHGLISTLHGGDEGLRVFASALSMIAFIGLALFELVWGAVVLKAALGDGQFLYYFTIVVFGLLLVSMMWTGGQEGALRSVQIQLLFAYIGLHMLTAWVIANDKVNITGMSAPFLFVLIFVAGSVAILYRLIYFESRGSWLMRLLNLGAILSLVMVLAAIVRSPGFFSPQSLQLNLPATLPEHGFWMLATMAFMPLVFQFVDMTNWQRLASLQHQGEEESAATARKDLAQYLIESPLSWLFPIAIGMGAVLFITTTPENPDPWLNLLGLAVGRQSQADGFGTALALFVTLGFICIFLSTANLLLSASGYAYAYDVNPKTRKIMDRQHVAAKNSTDTSTDSPSPEELASVTRTGKWATSTAIMLAVVLYIVVDMINPATSAQLIGLFLAFYAPILSFAPSILVPVLTQKRASPQVAFASMVLPAGLGLFLGIFSLWAEPGSVWQWLPVPVCFFSSWAIYLAGFGFDRQPIKTAMTTG